VKAQKGERWVVQPTGTTLEIALKLTSLSGVPVARGDQVLLSKLTNERSLKFNGARGVVGAYDATSQRFAVVLDDTPSRVGRLRIKVKSSNIQVITTFAGYPKCVDTNDEEQNRELCAGSFAICSVLVLRLRVLFEFSFDGLKSES
jgi:hypothetical protein